MIDDSMICHLLQADDLVLISETTSGLQSLLDGLNKFCDVWQIIVNLDKTNFMIFNKQYEFLTEYSKFVLKGNEIMECEKYKYLGTLFSNKKNMYNDNIKYIRDRAMQTMTVIFKNARQAFGSQTSYKLLMKLFDAQVRPLLEYGAEVWFCGKEIKDLEKVQLSFIKRAIGVKQSTSTLAIYGETGRYPLKFRLIDSSIKFWDRLNSCNKDKILYKTFLELKKLHDCGNKTWVTRTIDMIRESCPDEQTFHDALNRSNGVYLDTKEWRYRKFRNLWHNEILDTNKNPKLRTYITFKHNFEQSPYLIQYMPKRLQRTMSQFRTSSHKLRIETGRYEGLPASERICEFCTSGEVDDEIHLLLKCKYHDDERNKLLNILPQHITGDSVNTKKQFYILMSSSDTDIVYNLANFIHKCFIKRNEACD